MEQIQRAYLPAAGHDWMLPLYDPLVKLLGGDAARRALLDQAAIEPHQRVLDIGCGTGTLAVLIKRLYPDTDVIGLDPDPKALARAKQKAQRAAVTVQFDQGFAARLPYAAASVDRAISSFMFHHLERDEKEGMLREVRRILKPGGVFSMLDFAGPKAADGGFLARLVHSSHHLKDNSDERIVALMSHAELATPHKVKQGTMLLGHLTINYYQATVPRG